MKIKKMLRDKYPNLFKILAGFKEYIIIKRFKIKYPETKIIYRDNQVFYSQENQDYIVYSNFFKNEKDGVFCDIGGNHPLNINNTRYFEECGWKGYVFEPLPYMKQLWEKYRKAKFFPYAISDSEGEIVLSVVENEDGWEDMLSFIKETRDFKYEYKTNDITVEKKVLKNIFKQENITHIDYMSIDVEGHELNVINGIDFNHTKINVLTIENNSQNKRIQGDDEIRKIMLKNDYLFWGRIIGLDDIFVHKNFNMKE